MNQLSRDPYTQEVGGIKEAPTSFLGRFRYLGPSLIVTGAVIGSGELVLTTSLGAAAGWALLWWLLLSCWCKALVQAELARYTITTGDTYLRAINRLPGHFAGISWPIWMGILAYVPGTMGLGGIFGGAGQSLSFLGSLAGVEIEGVLCTGIIAIICSIILSTGSYKWLESAMLPLVVGFTLATLTCVVAMQFTEFAVTPSEIISGLKPDWALFVAFAALALSAYGYTGTSSGDISAYTYWCIEKGYPTYIGGDRDDAGWEQRAKGWIKVLHNDVWLALIIVTCATIPYYILGAGVLNQMGIVPEGNDETISALSNIFTQTLGQWAVWIFSIGAFFILFSTVLSGAGAGGRPIPDYLIEMKLIERSNLALRKSIIRWYLGVLPLIAFLIYLFVPNFVILIMIGGLTSALFLPIQSGATIYLQKKFMDPRVQPNKIVKYGLWLIFSFELIMAGFVVWFVVLAPIRG